MIPPRKDKFRKERACYLEGKARVRAKARAFRTDIASSDSSSDSSIKTANAIAHHLIEIPAVWSVLEKGKGRCGGFSSPVFASYAPSKGEVNPNVFLDLLRRMKLDRPLMAFPRVAGKVAGKNTLSMHFALLEELAPGSYGIPEPKDSAQVVLPENIDVILVPGLAFDRSGNRLGYGKGYYDHYLLALSQEALVVGIGYDECLYDEIPAEDHDVRMDYIVTPTEVLRF